MELFNKGLSIELAAEGLRKSLNK